MILNLALTVFVVVFGWWAVWAFIKPPLYHRNNYKRRQQELQREARERQARLDAKQKRKAAIKDNNKGEQR